MNRFELELRKRLEDLRDEAYAEFNARLVPGLEGKQILGVRIPELRRAVYDALDEIFGKGRGRKWTRKMGEELSGAQAELYHEMNIFLEDLPHRVFEYDLAHEEIVAAMGEFDECVLEVNKFLPQVNNWATCDSFAPRVFRKNLAEVLGLSYGWTESKRAFTVRYGMGMMMRYFLDERFEPEFLERVVAIARRADREESWTESEKYYVKMMVAWYVATALAKQWEAAVEILTEERLPAWTHNKAIQKAVESRRITGEQKEFLRGLKK